MVSGHSQLVGNDSHVTIARNDPPAPLGDKNMKQGNNFVIPETRESAETENKHNNMFLGISQSHDFNTKSREKALLTRLEEQVPS